jgi:hypothetical protein
MEFYDLAIAYKWIYDRELTELIEKMFQKNGLKTFIIGVHNLNEIIEKVKNDELSFTAILDRASDEDESFVELAKLITKKNTYIINEYEKIETAIDKAKMHIKLEKENFPLPFTIIAPKYEITPKLSISKRNRQKLKIPFVIKPAYYSGGGDGVVTDATTMQEIEHSRKINYDDRYLIQKKIYPKNINGRRVWLRVFWFFNEVFPVWWSDETHIYEEISDEETLSQNLIKMKDYTTKLAEITGLDYFSSEFTLDEKDNLFLIDYVNDQCDLRMKSVHHDGVPDNIVVKFVEKMFEKVNSLKS